MTKIICKIDAAFLGMIDAKRMKTQKKPEGVKSFKDIPYINDGNRYHQLDVYRPEGNEEVLPVIISVHGGSWCYGDKELYENFCMDLSKRNFAVVNFSYILSPDASYPEQLKDVYAVFAWVKENGDKYKLDLNNIFVTGDSAGAHLCGMAVNIIYNQSLQELFGLSPIITPNAMCLNCGATELKDLSNQFGKLVFKYMIGPGFKDSPYYEVANYSDSVTKDSCPVFFISSYADFMRHQACRIYKKVSDMGIPTEMHFRGKGDHIKGHKPLHVYNVLQPYWEESIEVTNKMCEFFRKYIK